MIVVSAYLTGWSGMLTESYLPVNSSVCMKHLHFGQTDSNHSTAGPYATNYERETGWAGIKLFGFVQRADQ